MAFTVTATQSGSSSNRGVFLLVRVLTGVTEAGGATSGGTSASGLVASGSLTPNFSGSWVVFSVSEDGVSGGLNAAAANNTYDANNGDATDGWSAAQGHYTGTVTASSALTYGEGSFAGGDAANWCAYEIPASGTPAVDGSSPAFASTTSATSIATASFSPPGSSVLVAQVTAGGTGTGTGITVTMTDTSGLGLAWTRRAISSTSNNVQPCYVFTATMPSLLTSGPALGGRDLGQRPAMVVTNAGWRGAQHSR